MQKDKSRTPLRVIMYVKAGCSLCDKARELLDEIAEQVEFELTEVDIRRDLQLFERYRYRIPVIVVNETIVLEGRIEYSELHEAFQNESIKG